ncbi:unnamed protein product, partial [Amoebophrya sp. A25]
EDEGGDAEIGQVVALPDTTSTSTTSTSCCITDYTTICDYQSRTFSLEVDLLVNNEKERSASADMTSSKLDDTSKSLRLTASLEYFEDGRRSGASTQPLGDA